MDAQYSKNWSLERRLNWKSLSACVEALDAGGDPNGDLLGTGKVMLVRAIEEGFLDGVRLLLDRGANPDGSMKQFVPLCIAVRQPGVDFCRELLDRGADINRVDSWRKTALHIASEWKREDVVELLLSRGADPQACDSDRETPLRKAIDSMPIIRRLVAAGASPSFTPPNPSPEYLTPFQCAILFGREEAAAYFIDECNEDPKQTTVNGRTMLQIAGNGEVQALLRTAILTRSIADGIDHNVHEGAAGSTCAPRPTLGIL